MPTPYGSIELLQASQSSVLRAKVAYIQYIQLNIECKSDLKDNSGLLQLGFTFLFCFGSRIYLRPGNMATRSLKGARNASGQINQTE